VIDAGCVYLCYAFDKGAPNTGVGVFLCQRLPDNWRPPAHTGMVRRFFVIGGRKVCHYTSPFLTILTHKNDKRQGAILRYNETKIRTGELIK
jgi:hypothetical protein